MKNILSLFIFAIIIFSCSSDDTATVQLIENPAIEAETFATVTEDLNGFLGVDDIITYNIAIKNTGDVSLSGIAINTALKDLNDTTLTLTTGSDFISSDDGSSEGSLLVGETATYSATYTITQSDIEAGGVSFRVTVRGTSPDNETVSDVSDNGDDTDGNIEDDPTETLLTETPLLKVVKTAEYMDDGNGYNAPNDIIKYTITVKNSGNVDLSEISLTDTLTDLNDMALVLDQEPTFLSADAGSIEGVLIINETATYEATYTTTLNDFNSGGLINTATATGLSPADVEIEDISDNGNDADGNTENDSTQTPLESDCVSTCIIAEYHMLNYSGNVTAKFIFDANGRIDHFVSYSNGEKYFFEFDSENRLINYTITDLVETIIESKDIIYDSDNRIIQAGDIAYEYNETENYYLEIGSYEETGPYIDGDFEYFEYSERRLYERPITARCSYYYQERTNLASGETYVSFNQCGSWDGYVYSTTTMNVVAYSDEDRYLTQYTYDANVNPLSLYDNTNLKYAFNFAGIRWNWAFRSAYFIFSQNNPIRDWPEPDHSRFTYILNSAGLPVSSMVQTYYDDEFYSERSFANYYYQGDDIPE